MMTTPFVTPLQTVSGELLYAMNTSSHYREAAEWMLACAWRFDGNLAHAVETPMTDTETQYLLNPNRLDQKKSEAIFADIREHKDKLDTHAPLLSHALTLFEHVSHFTTNILPFLGDEPLLLAVVSSPAGRVEMIHDETRISFQWSLDIFLGMSPLPLFRTGIFYDERVMSNFSRFGLGIFTYLSLALRPSLAHGGFLPEEIAYRGVPRPVVPAPILRHKDDSIELAFLPT